jgi:peptide/nickel transport system ATP-binding protein
MGILFVTHLGVVAEIADRVAVMYAGRIVEMGKVAMSSPARATLYGRPDGIRAEARRGCALKATGTPLPTIAGSVPSLPICRPM